MTLLGLCLWFSVKVKEYFESVLQDGLEEESPSDVWRNYCHLANRVDRASHTMGKDGKFQLFICLATRYNLSTVPLLIRKQLSSTVELQYSETYL